jgi:hypothetical protein
VDDVDHLRELRHVAEIAGEAAAAEIDTVDVVLAPTRFKFDAPVVLPAITDFGEHRPARLELGFEIAEAGVERDVRVVDPVGAALGADIPTRRALARVRARRQCIDGQTQR